MWFEFNGTWYNLDTVYKVKKYKDKGLDIYFSYNDSVNLNTDTDQELIEKIKCALNLRRI